MSAELIFIWTGKAFWLCVCLALVVSCVVAVIGAAVWAAHKTFNGASSWLGARYILDPRNKAEIREKIARYHASYGLPAKALEDWMVAVWENRDRIDETCGACPGDGRMCDGRCKLKDESP